MGKAARDIARACIMACLAIGVFVAAETCVYYILNTFGVNTDIYAGLYALIATTATLVFLLLFLKLSENGNSGFIKIQKPKAKDTGLAIFVALGLLGVVTMYMFIANQISEWYESMKSAMEEYSQNVDRYSDVEQSAVPLWDSILYICVTTFLVPASEELIFRGAVLGQMRKILNVPFSIIVSALVFGVMHGVSIHIGYAVICGLVLGCVYVYTNNLFESYLVHMIFNLFGSGIPTFLSLEALNFNTDVANNISYWLLMAEYFCMIPGSVAFVMLWYRYAKAREEAKANEKV